MAEPRIEDEEERQEADAGPRDRPLEANDKVTVREQLEDETINTRVAREVPEKPAPVDADDRVVDEEPEEQFPPDES